MPSSAIMSAPTANVKSTPKAGKKSIIVTLRISPDHLSRFLSKGTLKPSLPASSPPARASSTNDKASESNGTPMPSNPYVTVTDITATPASFDSIDGVKPTPATHPHMFDKLGRRRRGAAAFGGPSRKRAPPSIDPNGPLRERGRPGPKKKPRLPDGTIDRTNDTLKPAGAGGNPTPAHRLGPKANTGNINANLRALDRTGKPCRRWERKPLVIKSFTGMMWGMPSWKAPLKDEGFAGSANSDSTGSTDLKPNDSSAVASERSNSGGDANGRDVVMVNGIESSPAPPLAA